jgi:phospholipid/cholesterol/gamma-HCH transport system ATP-binding protein
MISVAGLHKGFDGQEILKGIELGVEDGEIMVVLGPSGQGKTVLIKTMVRLLEADSGIINYDDINIGALNRGELREFRRQIAFVFQNGALLDFLNVADNLALFPRMHRNMANEEIVNLAMMMLSLVGLEESVCSRFPEELSGGMKKRVAIARAMMKDPKYLFYDELTSGLDRGNSRKIAELIRTLKARTGVTSVIVTHDVELMREVADRVALLKRGKILFIGRPGDVSSRALDLLYTTGENNGL